MILHLDVSYLTDTQKSYLPLLLDHWPGFPIKKNGAIITIEINWDETLDYSSIKIKVECKLEQDLVFSVKLRLGLIT